MNNRRALAIIDLEEPSTSEEEFEAFKTFFAMFGVQIQHEEGTYKTMWECFEEAGRVFKDDNDE